MGAVVVEHEVDFEVGRHLRVDMAQEGDKLLGSVSAMQLGHDSTRGHLQCREQDGGAMAPIVMRAGLGDSIGVRGSPGWVRSNA